MIRWIRSKLAYRAFVIVRWWLTDRKAHKLTSIDGLDHHLGAGTFKGGFVQMDPHTRTPVGLVMFWLPEWSVDISGFEKIELTVMRKHPTLNEVVFYVPS